MRASEVKRCEACGRLVALVSWPPNVITLNMAWVHITRYGRIRRRVRHKPVIS